MVVGAYTIINTIGLLVGLPYNIQNDTYYNINKNFSTYLENNYVSNNVLNVSSLNNLAIIIDFSTNLPATNSNLTISSDKVFNNGTSDITDFSFTYSTKVDKYAIYTYTELENNASNGTAYFLWNTETIQYKVNQIYIARLTSSLSSINGDSIINSITSGLGLMGDITTNFKNGFSALIWNSNKNSLTTFGNFALIFLGVSITFAIIKLCLNLIRSKTGA